MCALKEGIDRANVSARPFDPLSAPKIDPARRFVEQMRKVLISEGGQYSEPIAFRNKLD